MNANAKQDVTSDKTARRLELRPSGDAVHLQAHRYAYLHDAIGMKVKVLTGRVWITQDGDSRDIVIEAGQSFAPDRNGDVLLSPLRDATLSVTHDCRRQAVPQTRAKQQAAPVLSAVRALFA